MLGNGGCDAGYLAGVDVCIDFTEPGAIKQRLVEQVTGLVRWRESVQYMKSQGVEMLVECGSGKVLSGLARRIDKDMTGLPLNTPADIEAFLKTA